MNCYVYRSKHKQGLYLYLAEKDDFSRVPDSLLKLLGETLFSFEFNLSEDRKLVRAEASEVIRNMKENGFFLQMPPARDELPGRKSNLIN